MVSSIDSDDSSILSEEELELEQPGEHLANTLLVGGVSGSTSLLQMSLKL